LPIVVAGVAALAGGVALATGMPRLVSQKSNDRTAAVVDGYRIELDSLENALVALATTLDHAAHDSMYGRLATADAQRAFRRARASYKRIELFAEYYTPLIARELNGAALTRTEEEDPDTPLQPIGFQVVEASVFPEVKAQDLSHAAALTRAMRGEVERLRRRGADTLTGDSYVFDAARHEIARVSTLGIAGFDATISRDASIEAAEALDGVARALAPYRRDATDSARLAFSRFDNRLAAATEYLRSHADFESLDRLELIAIYTTPLAHDLARIQRSLGIATPPITRPRAWSSRAPSIYDSAAIDPMYFAPLDAPTQSTELIALGKRLFFDPILSGSRNRACSACHDPARAFTDGRAQPALLSPHGTGRNTPTLVNAGLQLAMFADSRATHLEDQAADVIGSRNEMGGTLRGAAQAVARDSSYRASFAAVFRVARDSAITPLRVTQAIAAYVRSLRATSSRFDCAVAGDTGALSSDERRGFNLFMGKALCGTCHFAPLFNGATPPWLTEAEPEVIGVPLRAVKRGAVIDPDSGRFNVRRIDQHLHAFRTPTLRNIELTAPYMHNGVFKTLDEVIDFYDGGGGHGIGIELPHQTLPVDSLRLTLVEKKAVIAFLRALTDTVGTR